MKNNSHNRYYWNKLVQHSLADWVGSAEINWACITFGGRILPARIEINDLQQVQQGYMSGNHLGRTFSKSQLHRGFEKCMHQLNFKFLSNRERRQGRNLCCVPFEGGNPAEGIWQHIHALVEIPTSTSCEAISEYLGCIAPQKMRALCRINPKRIQMAVWCKPYIKSDGNFLTYASRYEGDRNIYTSFDKVIVPSLVLPAS